MLKINVSTAEAVVTETELITAGRKGLRCAFTFSEDWAGLAKTAIVQGAATRDIALLATNEITVPAECVNKAQFPLKIGVYGARPDGTIAIPTIWASFGKVLPGAKPSDIPPDELTPDVVAQIQEAANNALYLARNVQSMADSGALDGVSPAVTVTSITGGHNVKITDRDHPDGQDFDVPDGQDGEDGEDGNGIWWTVSRITSTGVPGYGEIRASYLKGRSGTPAAHDLVIGPAIGDSGSIAELYEISSVATGTCALKDIGSLKGAPGAPGAPGDPGADGYAPEVTIEQIDGGHRITITDEAHPDGQSFDVMDGQGGSGSSDYNDLSNKPSIAGVTLSGNKSLADFGIAAASDIPTVPVQSVNGKTGAVVLNASDVGAGTYSKPSGGIPNSDLAEDAQRGYVVDDAAKGEVILAEATYYEWEEVDDTPPYWNASYSSGAPGPETTPFPDAVIITLDGVPYKVPRTPAEPSMANYGCLDDEQFPDFPQFFPVAISFWDEGFELFVQTGGDHTISVNAATKEVNTTPDFDAAVAKSSAEALAEKLDTGGDAYRAASLPMGQLDSTSTATVMTATIPGITELRDGVCVWLTNGVITSAAGVTLNINNLGAKPIYNSIADATATTTTFAKAYTMLFIYNSTRVSGGCWDMVYGYDANTTYTPAKLGQGYGVCSTAAATVAKTASISSYTLTTGGIVAIKFNEDVPANATLNINSKGAKAIYYKGAAITAGVIKAGDTVTMIYSTYYHVLSIDRDVDTLPPSPSDMAPSDVNNIALPGTSTEYARADHIHGINLSYLENRIAEIYAVNVAVFLYDGQNGVYIGRKPQNLASAYQSQLKMNFALVVPPDYDHYPVLFTPSKFDTTTGELHLTGIASGVLYEATLLPGADPTGQSAGVVMVGTMTTTNLALPSAQGVSF